MSLVVSAERPTSVDSHAPGWRLTTLAGAFSLPRPAAKPDLPVTLPADLLRSRLTVQLDAGPRARAALLVAPPGAGKSSLVRHWCQEQGARLAGASPRWIAGRASGNGPSETDAGRRAPGTERRAVGRVIAWLTLNVEDNDPARFLLSLCAALEPIVPEAAARARALLRSSPAPSLQPALRPLLTGLRALPPGPALVLDDYHVIEARAVHDLAAVLLEYLPPSLFLILASRSDPPLPFDRLGQRGQLVEIRDADLRFTDAEAAAFLKERMGLSLPPESVARLNRRTEGWIAALHAAAHLLQGEPDPAGFLDAFTGSRRYLVDDLFEHALRRQPPAAQQFLSRAAFLDRLCGPLCEAVTGMPGAGAALLRLAAGHLFLAPLDTEGRWYRFNPLFAGALRAWSLSQQGER